jgi:transposase InsO family protein
MDWYSRTVLAWQLSNTMDASFCVTALEQALARFGKPESMRSVGARHAHIVTNVTMSVQWY